MCDLWEKSDHQSFCSIPFVLLFQCHLPFLLQLYDTFSSHVVDFLQNELDDVLEEWTGLTGCYIQLYFIAGKGCRSKMKIAKGKGCGVKSRKNKAETLRGILLGQLHRYV